MSTSFATIVVPVFGDIPTLARALGSLTLQTFAGFDVVVVNDGDDAEAVDAIVGLFARSDTAGPEASASPRGLVVRVVHLSTNRGRGVARQIGLDHAVGAWVGFLDADDWWAPEKLALQRAKIDAAPELVVVSTGLAIVDGSNTLRGVRCADTEDVVAGAVPFAPSLVRRQLAQSVGFESNAEIGEDRAFLRACLAAGPWAVIPEPLYIYDEYGRPSVHDEVARVRTHAGGALRREASSPSRLARGLAEAARAGARVGLHAVGLGEWLIGRRSRAPTAAERAGFARARAKLDARLAG